MSSTRAERVRAAAARVRTGMPASAAMSLRLRWRYSFLAYLGRLMATRGMNRSSTIARKPQSAAQGNVRFNFPEINC